MRFVVLALFISLVTSVHINIRKTRSVPQKAEHVWSNVDWNKLGRNRILKAASSWKVHKAKNVILFLGDGMGLSTIASARAYKAQETASKLENSYLTMETLPFSGLSRTYSVDRITSDSAATSTAYLSGIKANMGTLGVNEIVEFDECHNMTNQNKAISIGKHFMREGKSVGIVTTARVTHASPAGVYAHVPNRNWEAVTASYCQEVNDIAYQLVHDRDNQNIKVVLGGGRTKFLSNGDEDADGNKGERMDGKNLIQEWIDKRKKDNKKYSFVQNSTEFHDVDPSSTDYLLGLFTSSHMSFDSERDESKEPSLVELTEKAIKILNNDKNGFFLFVEGARIDHAHHQNKAFRAIKDTLAFDEAINKTLKLTKDYETLVVVTADHSHVVTLGGYGSSTGSVLGFADDGELAKDDKPYLQIQYANGPGFENHRLLANGAESPRRNISETEAASPDFIQDAGIWLNDETHGGEDVAIFASGPMSHLLHSAEEQTFVAHLMMAASCVGQYSQDPHCSSSGLSALSLPVMLVILVISTLAQF